MSYLGIILIGIGVYVIIYYFIGAKKYKEEEKEVKKHRNSLDEVPKIDEES